MTVIIYSIGLLASHPPVFLQSAAADPCTQAEQDCKTARNNFVHRPVMAHKAGAWTLPPALRERSSLPPVSRYKGMKGKDKHRCTK